MMEPERPIEKLLRGYAKKRREEAGAPLELHPATRKMLQDEVARKHAQPGPAPKSFSRFLALFGPRLAWGAAVLVFIGLLAALIAPTLNKKQKESLYASDKETGGIAQPTGPVPTEPPESLAAAPATAAATAPTPTTEFDLPKDNLALADRSVQENKLGVGPLEARSSLQSSPAAPPKLANGPSPVAAAESVPSLAPEKEFARRYGLAPATPAAKPSSAPEVAAAAVAQPLSFDNGKAISLDDSQSRFQEKSVSLAAEGMRSNTSLAFGVSGRTDLKAEDFAKSSTGAKAQRFLKVEPLSKAKVDLSTRVSVTESVLSSFQIEQSGRELRVIDADGSVYTGYVQPQIAQPQPRSQTLDRDAGAAPKKAVTSTPQLSPTETASADAESATAESYYFSVAGTNGTLKERVVFSGDLSSMGSAIAVSVTNAVGGGALFDTKAPTWLKAGTRISGRAKIGNRNEIEIQAVPTSP